MTETEGPRFRSLLLSVLLGFVSDFGFRISDLGLVMPRVSLVAGGRLHHDGADRHHLGPRHHHPLHRRVGELEHAVLMLLGLPLLLPKFVQWAARTLRPLMDWACGSEGTLAVDSMIQSPRRTSATVGALMIGLMFVFSTGAYIQSYEQVILRWMNRTINSDLFVTTSELARSRTYHFSEEVSQRIAEIPGVKRLENVRFTFVPYGGDNVALIAIEAEGWFARVRDIMVEGDEKKARQLMPKGEGILISYNFSTRWAVGTQHAGSRKAN